MTHRRDRAPWILPALGLSLSLLSPCAPSLDAAEVVVRPADTGEVLSNPQMGWVLHFYDNIPENYGSRLEPSDTVDDFPGISVVYLRIPWSYIEPEEGRFVWSVVDAPAQRWIDKGKQAAFRFSCSESWMRWATPGWVADAGAKGHDFSPGKGVTEKGPFWEPDYGDPVFLEKLDKFLEAAARRYDGNPKVAFIDVGSFGVWGEGHTFASSKLKVPAEVVKKHIDLHLKHFKKTLLAANDDFSFQGDETIQYAREKGLTLRDDSILVQPPPNSYFHAAMAQDFWPKLPVILESEHYGPSKSRGAWGDGSLYLKAVEEYHASWASIHWWPREFFEAEKALVGKINSRLGYRLRLQEAAWAESVSLSDPFSFRSVWANAGVAPCYPGGHVAVTLADSKGGIVAVFVEEGFNVRDLPVGPPLEAPSKEIRSSFRWAHNVTAGKYDVYVSVGARDGTPAIALPLAGSDGHGRYRLGTVQLFPRP
jgi:hypothetical protein